MARQVSDAITSSAHTGERAIHSSDFIAFTKRSHYPSLLQFSGPITAYSDAIHPFALRRLPTVSPAAFGPRAGHLSVQHITLHQPGQGRQGLSFVAEGAAAHDSVRLHTSVWGKSPPPRWGSTDGSKQRLQGFCSTAIAFLPPTERSDRGNTAVGHRTRVLQQKGDGGLRPILDLRRLNFSLYKGKFKMLTIKTIMSQIQEGDWFVTIDLKDAYFHIQIVQRHRRFLRFAFGGKAYQYKVLPFGLALAPRTFTKCMDAALAPLRLQGIHVLNFLDDWLILAHSRELVSRQRDIVLRHIHSLGLRMNAKKSVLLPSQRTLFLGVHFDSIQMQARLAPARISNFYSMSGPLQAGPACLCRFMRQAARPHGSGLPCVALRVASHEAVPLVDKGAEFTPHCTSHSPYQGVARLLSTPFTMAGPRFSSERGKNRCDSPSPYGHDGRINDGLRSGLQRQTGERGMDRRGAGNGPLLAHKLPGTQGCLPGFYVFSPHPRGASYHSQDGQHGGCVPHKASERFTVVHPGQACAPSSPWS